MKKKIIFIGLLLGFLFCFFTMTAPIYAAEDEDIVEGVLVDDDIPDYATFIFEEGGNYCSITFDEDRGVCTIEASIVDPDTGELIEDTIKTEFYVDGVNGTITVYDAYGDVWQVFKISVDGTRIKPIYTDDVANEDTDETSENKVTMFMDWARNLSFTDFQNIVIGICAFLGIDILAIISGIFLYLKSKSKEIKNNKIYQATIEEMDAKHKEELAAITETVNALAKEINTNIKLAINQQSAEKQKETAEKAQQVANELDAIVDKLK